MSDREQQQPRRLGRRGAGRSRARPGEEERAGEEVHVGGRTRGRARGVPAEEAGRVSPEEWPTGESPEPGEEAIVEGVRKLKFVELATRPGYGTAGRKVAIYANHYEITIPKGLTVFQYHVDITLAANANFKLNRDEKRYCFWQLIGNTTGVFGELDNILFDGDHICICTGQLKFPTTNAESGMFKFNLPVTLKRLRQAKEIIGIQFQIVGAIDISMRDVEVAEPTDRYTTPLSVLDILFRQGRSCHLVNDSKGWYPFASTLYRIPDRGAAPELGIGQEIWQGLFSSARVGEDYKPFVNLDVSHSSFYKDQPLVDFMIEILNAKFAQRGERFTIDQMDADTRLDARWVRELNKELIGKKVFGAVRRQNGTVEDHEYRVTGILAKNALEETFPKRDPTTNIVTEVTIAEHFTERYGPLKYPSLNVVQVRGERGPKLPMEHLRIVTPQRVAKKLTPAQTATMIKVAAMDAPTRQLKIQQLTNDSRFDNDRWLNRYGIRVTNRMTEIPNARVLNSPRIEYAPNGQRGGPVVSVKEGVWNGQQQKFFIGGRCEQLGAIIIDGATDLKLFEDFFTVLLGVCREAGMQVPRSIPQLNYLQVSPSTAMNEISQKLEAMNQKGLQLVFVVLPEKNSPIPIYAEVKRCAEIMLGMMTQCVCKPTIQKTMTKRDRVTPFNIAMKVNTKLGGVNWKCVPEMLAKKLLSDKPTLIMGVDVAHPSPSDKKTPSISAVVGNLDVSFMKYGASVRVQKHRQESVVYLHDPVRDRLVDHFTYRQEELAKAGMAAAEAKPQRIIVFRDGVAEGQFQEVLRTELVGIRQACEHLESDYKPSITVIIAQKRHHTRFFPRAPSEGSGRARNIYPGTVVDTVITHPKQFEFYLCSHYGIQGTSRPIRYHVLTDDNKFSADEIQALTFYMTHCYARCTRAVSIPAPLYYADLACTRARDHLHAQIGDFSTDTLSPPAASAEEGARSSSSVSEDELVRGVQIHPNLKMRMYFV